MTQPPPAPRRPAEDPGDDGPPPYLLAMPAVDGASGAPGVIPWPEGQPAWAIPVSLPPGTRGYAVFIPLVPVADAAAAPSAGTVLATGHGPAGTPAPADTTPADTTPEGVTRDGVRAGAGPGTTTPAPVTAPVAGTTPSAAATTPAGDNRPENTPPTGSPQADDAAADRPPVDDAAADKPTTDEPVADGAAADGPHGDGPAAAGAPAVHGVPPYAWAVDQPGRPGAVGGPPYPPTPGGYYRPKPPGPTFFQRYWPGPKPAQGRAVPLAVLVGALGVAFFVPLSRTGIGWFLGWLALTAGVVAAVRGPVAQLPRTERWVRAGWAGAALALLAVPAFRNAWWLVTFCVLAALGCAALAVIGGRRIRSILFSLVAGPVAAFRGLPWVRAHVRSSADPGLARRVVGSAVATIAALVVFGNLLASADGAFSVLLSAVVPEIDLGTVFRWFFLAAVGALCAVAAVWTLAAPPDLSGVDRPTRRSFGMLEWAPAITALTLLFGGFVAVQFTVLFGGERHVLRTAGLSYAEYARSGFWQLVAVTLLTLAVLGGVGRWARREHRTERIMLRVLLGALSVLSVVIVISALSRMYAYQKVYSFTGERLFVMAFELLLGSVFLMILAAGLRLRGGWVPRGTVALAVTMLLSLAVLNPEGYAAGRNIDRYRETGKIDAWYLRALSADATPALTGLPDPVRRCTLSWIADELDEPDPWYAWNLGRLRARQALDRVGPDAIGGPSDCRAADQYDLPKSRRPR
ncbi:DUF4153 domain-containing protein [Micromonospora cathayae]|uniref:DUF4173 domain-containing protein n=1 Tax=Micromonospora cathayae TaxID=3028804 RepID=A0ABY7ZV14_9ACTN|nr:DUF4153 domain-containing protein [Micromonospora sp. HUAS 3]WDZ86246.1 DUF4173 domain-containing protein [Micromonospora sp. HUAS 3]